MNILILAAGYSNLDSKGERYPLALTEFNGVPLIERLISSCQSVGDPINFIVALRDEDIRHYHLDNVIRLLSPSAKILNIPNKTKGAACTALLAASYIDTDDELLILNGNELLEVDFSTVLADFRNRNLDAGVITFSSVHPRYSYVRLQDDGFVIEAAEKNPISRNATVGFYWFNEGASFVAAAKNMIRKDASVGELYYICPSLNELILNQNKIGVYEISPNQYHPFKSERQVEQFENVIEQRKIL